MRSTQFAVWTVALAALLLGVGGCDFGNWYPQVKFERTVELQHAMQPGTTLAVSTASGSIDAAGQETDTAQVVATIVARAGTEEEAQELAEAVEIGFEETAERLEIKADRPKTGGGRSISISYEITLPRQSHVECNSASGSIDVRDLNGNVKSHAASGSVKAARVEGSVRLDSSSGSVRCEQVEGGDIRLGSASGSVRLSKASNVGVCDLHSSSGSATATDVQADSIKLGSASGSVTLIDAQAEAIDMNASSGPVKGEAIACSHLTAKSVSGSVSVALSPSAPSDIVVDAGATSGSVTVVVPPGFAGQVDLSAISGSVTIDLPVAVQGRIDRRHVKGTVGEGSGRLTIRSASGSIRVK